MRNLLENPLKENCLRCKMTQEFVAETLGVSRQAVSKWENGTSDPNTTNLIALSRLYKVTPEDLLNVFKKRAYLMNRQARQKGKYIMKKHSINILIKSLSQCN